MTYQFKFHKNSFIFFQFLIALLIFQSCATLPDTKPITKYYCVGKGGGFTNDFKEYSFSEDGKVYKRDFTYERDVYYKNLTPLDLEFFLSQIRTLGLEYEELNQPGNMVYYIEIRDNETTRNKIVWGAPNYNPPEEMEQFFNELYNKLSERP